MDPGPEQKENISGEPLTCIRDAYTLYDTPEEGGDIDRVMVNHFLHTLAEVALAVAARKIEDKEEKH